VGRLLGGFHGGSAGLLVGMIMTGRVEGDIVVVCTGGSDGDVVLGCRVGFLTGEPLVGAIVATTGDEVDGAASGLP
jgi:hypothetical protein